MPGFLRRLLGGQREDPRAADERAQRGQGGGAQEEQEGGEVQGDESLLDAAAGGAPFTNGATRGDLAWAIMRDVLGQRRLDRNAAMAAATQRGIFNGQAADEAPSRAQAVTMIQRALGFSLDLPEGQVAYFADVAQGAPFFDTIHAARRHGLVVGNGNRFRPNDAASISDLNLMLARARRPQPVSVEAQSPDVAPVLRPLTADQALMADMAWTERDELSPQEIEAARGQIQQLPPDQRPRFYRLLAGKVSYRNQRNNVGRYAASEGRGDVMCNMTSLAMTLEGLGIGQNDSTKQFEDELDETRAQGRMGSRYEFVGQRNVARRYGAASERVPCPWFRNGAAAQLWYNENVLPRLEQGAQATMSIAFGARRNDYHIVRLQWVDSDGLLVDDPYGTLYRHRGGYYTYNRNEREGEDGDAARGEDSKWSWETVAQTNRSRYVQFITRDDG